MALTEVKLLRGVDLTTDYRDSFSFTSKASQEAFFSTKLPSVNTSRYYRNNLSFQRKNADGINVGSLIWSEHVDAILNASYLMFKNGESADPNKVWYAFITDIKYVGMKQCEILFQIDELQTWLFDVRFGECLIEREHVTDDSVGVHLVQEDVGVGALKTRIENTLANLKNLSIVVTTSVASTTAVSQGVLMGGSYQGLGFFLFDADAQGVIALNNWLNGINGDGLIDVVNSIFMMAKDMLPNYTNGEQLTDIFPVIPTQELTWTTTKSFTNIDGYEPHNNKLFTYPYNFIRVSNNQGGLSDVKYEHCSNQSYVEFKIRGEIASNPSLLLSIQDYYGEADNVDEGLILTGYPTCSWNKDAYVTWLAQNKASNFISATTSVGALAFGVATANPLAIGGGVVGVASQLGKFSDATFMPNQAKGNTSGSIMLALDRLTYTFRQVNITQEYAKMIDDYFDRFGYKVMRNGLPVVRTRLNWNYLKMADASISGDMPNKSKETIKNIFLTGVTFWHSDQIGNYTLSNTPL